MRLLHRHLLALTALELLVAIALTGIVAGLGAPMLRDTVWNARRTATLNNLLAAVQLARSTAMSRQATTVLCKADERWRCTDQPSDGTRWLVTIAASDNGESMPTAEAIEPLRRITLRPAGTVVSNRSAYEFRPFPRRSGNGTISLCDPRGAQAQRAIVISPTGRPRLVTPDPPSALAACAAQ